MLQQLEEAVGGASEAAYALPMRASIAAVLGTNPVRSRFAGRVGAGLPYGLHSHASPDLLRGYEPCEELVRPVG